MPSQNDDESIYIEMKTFDRYCTSKANFNVDYIANKDENDLYDEIKETAS